MDALLRLATAQRNAQQRLADSLAALVAGAYRTQITPQTIGNQTMVEAWIATVVPLVLDYRRRSLELARPYYGLSRTLAGITERMPDVPSTPLGDEQIHTSLQVTGVIGAFERMNAGQEVVEAISHAGTAAQGAAARHALNGGRDWLANAWRADERADVATYRITRPGCCWFCAMLASRGAVYRSDSFDDSDPRFVGEGDVKVHDHCYCTQGYVRRDGTLPDFNGQMTALWEQVNYDGGKLVRFGAEARTAFRRAYEATLRA